MLFLCYSFVLAAGKTQKAAADYGRVRYKKVWIFFFLGLKSFFRLKSDLLKSLYQCVSKDFHCKL